MQTKQSEEPRALSLQEMEETNGGHSAEKEIGCGIMNMAIIASLYGGPLGWIGAAGILGGAIATGCYKRG